MELAKEGGGVWYRNGNGIPTRHRPPAPRGRTTTNEVLALTGEQRLRLSAMHEAGHAALWHELGVRLDKVWVRTVSEAERLGERQAGGTTAGATATIGLVDASRRRRPGNAPRTAGCARPGCGLRNGRGRSSSTRPTTGLTPLTRWGEASMSG
jgi:hypothetical protein